MRSRNTRTGFTLVEMLVAIGIFVILTVITIAAVNITMGDNGPRAVVAQVRSQLQGAQSRAAYFSRPVGVEFIRDPNDDSIITGTIYVGEPEPYKDGSVAVMADQRTVIGTGTRWATMLRNGAIKDFGYISLDGQLFTYTTQNLSPGSEQLTLTKDFQPPGGLTPPYQIAEYQMLLEPMVLPNQEPVNFPRGIAIDLDSSIVPIAWGIPGDYATKLRIMFSPRGDAEVQGGCRLVFSTIEDIDLGNRVEVIDRKQESRVVSVLHSGKSYSSPVDYTDANANGRADDPFNFAETGEEAVF